MERRYKKIIGKEAFREKKRNGNSNNGMKNFSCGVFLVFLPQNLRRFHKNNAASRL
jgi:hypothetical protein